MLLLGPEPHLYLLAGSRDMALFGLRCARPDRTAWLALARDGWYRCHVGGAGEATGELRGVGDPDASPSIWGMDVTGGRMRDAMWELRDAGELARAASILRDLPSLVSMASQLPRRY